MSALLKSDTAPVVKHPARPSGKKVDVKTFHARMEKRYPKILAKLAE